MHLRHINNSDVPLHCFEGGKGETRIRERSMRLLDQTWRMGCRVRGVEIRRRQMVTGRGARPVGGGRRPRVEPEDGKSSDRFVNHAGV